MEKRNHYFKRVYWLFVCAFILTGCSNYHSTEEKPEMEPGNVSVEADWFAGSETERELELEPIISCCSGKRNF